MVAIPADGAGPQGQFHSSELANLVLAISRGAGVEQNSYTMTVTEANLVVTIPAFIAVVPDGSGSYVLIEKTSPTNVTMATADGTNPRTDIIHVDASGNVGKTDGTPTAEATDLADAVANNKPMEAPMPALASDEILLAKVRVDTGDTAIPAAQVAGRAVRSDIYRQRYLLAWAADNAQNPNLDDTGSNNLPAGTFVELPFVFVTQAFNSDGNDEITVGYTADPDAFGKAVDVSAIGIQNPVAGAEHGFLTTARAAEAFYVNSGSEPNAGKAIIKLPYHFVSPIIS